ncbi:HEAT repeat domain-containing protein [[Phormidium] sp. ETS-05]|uniref:HEAT repeat domain-containing protein n=1 Tax=[Phormidium] sp. ETS-05 TaxID=222819 RepID=UPI0018EF0844|nr:HEAT repeat domain-containing protein [[Phormidium] sp. ETS-05]
MITLGKNGAAQALIAIAPNNYQVGNQLIIFWENFLGSDSDFEKVEAAKAIATINTSHSGAIKILIESLFDIQWKVLDVRNEAEILQIAKFGRFNFPPLEPKIIDLSNEEDQLTYILSDIEKGNSIAIEGLLDLIKNCSNRLAQYHAILILGEIGIQRDDVIEVLTQVQKNSPYLDIRHRAMDSLLKIQPNNLEVIQNLWETILNTDNPEKIRDCAIRSLAYIDINDTNNVANLLTLGLFDSDNWLCQTALEVIEKMA